MMARAPGIEPGSAVGDPRSEPLIYALSLCVLKHSGRHLDVVAAEVSKIADRSCVTACRASLRIVEAGPHLVSREFAVAAPRPSTGLARVRPIIWKFAHSSPALLRMGSIWRR